MSENINRLKRAIEQIDEAQPLCPSPECDCLSDAAMNIDLVVSELEAECIYCKGTRRVEAFAGNISLGWGRCTHCASDVLEKQLAAKQKELENAAKICIEQANEIVARDKEIKGLKKQARCPCGGWLEGMGYCRSDKTVIFQCAKCKARMNIREDIWKLALKDVSGVESKGKEDV